MARKNPYSILNHSEPDLAPQYNPSTKVQRYRKGQAPTWVDQDSEPAFKLQAPVEKAAVKAPEPILTQISVEPLPEEQEQVTPHLTEESSDNEFPEEEYLEDFDAPPLPKPCFVQKDERSTQSQREALEQSEKDMETQFLRLKQQKLANTREVVDHLLHSVPKQESSEEASSTDSSDEEVQAEEFKQWKVRELQRIIRDREERESRTKELAEIERRRTLTDWERREEDKLLGNDESARPEQRKIAFMQKWYHKGVFFQERDSDGKLHPLFMRDYNTPVNGDFDKSVLPKILQKRRGEFGKKGQSKYTHLCEEDTTQFNPEYAPNPELLFKQQLQSGGYKSMNSFSK